MFFQRTAKISMKQEEEVIMVRLFGDDKKVGNNVEQECEEIKKHGKEGKG